MNILYPWHFGAAVICLMFQFVNSNPTALEYVHRQKREGEMSTIISGLAQQFFNRGGQQGVNDLNNAGTSESKIGVLQRYLGPMVLNAILNRNSGSSGNTGNSNSNDLVSSILGSFMAGGGGNRDNNRGNYGTGSSNYSPSRPSAGGYVNREPLPGSNSKTGVSLIDSRPGDRARTPAPSYDRDNDNYDRFSGNRDTYSPPTSGGSRTGVSLVDSRPGERNRDRPSSGRNYDNEDDGDSDSITGGFNEDNSHRRRGSSGTRGNPRDRGFSEDKRTGSSSEIFRGASGRGNSRNVDADY